MTLLDPQVRELLDGVNVAHVATLMPDGAPHAVPMWVGRVGDRVAFLTDPLSRKGRNIAADPRVSISITDREQPNRMAHIRGRVVEVVSGEAGWRLIDDLAQKYIGAPYPLRTDRAAYLVEPERAFAQAFG
jgi:PPOX class probable F420-dependent enzyme